MAVVSLKKDDNYLENHKVSKPKYCWRNYDDTFMVIQGEKKSKQHDFESSIKYLIQIEDFKKFVV